MATFWTSDSHFNHVNVLHYCGRPFTSMEDMEAELVRRWNVVVGPEDHVFHLGDVAMGPNLKSEVTRIRSRLNGRITLIRGNHDRSRGFYLDCGFDEVLKHFSGTIDGQYVYARHHPPARPEAKWDEYDLILVGHVHEAWVHRGKIINVGVDAWDFTPHTIDQMIDKINESLYPIILNK